LKPAALAPRLIAGSWLLLVLAGALLVWWMGFWRIPRGMLVALIGLFCLFTLGSWQLRLTLMRQARAEEQLRRLNADLEARIADRTLELQARLRELSATNAELSTSHDTLRSVVDTSMDGFWRLNANGEITDANPMYSQMSGYDRAELLTMRIGDIEAQETPEDTAQRLERLKANGRDRFETQHRRKDGSVWDVEVSVSCHKASEGGMFGFLRDITLQKQQQATLEQVAHFDVLTQLPNRALLTDRLSQKLAHGQRSHEMIAVCMLDLDGFKPVNDQFGHKAGDQLLREVAQRLRESIRQEDLAGRLGGDEFVLAIGGLSSIDECHKALTRVLEAVAAPYQVTGRIAQVSCSIGVSIFPGEGSDPEQLIRQADEAMYHAKKAGKNRYQLFDPSYELHSQARSGTMRKIGKALSNGQFELLYQPKINCRLGCVVGYEALLRWNHPILGTMAPAEFMPLIDHEDLVLDVGEWVLTAVLRQQLLWLAQGQTLAVTINVAGRHLLDHKFSQKLQSLLADHPPALVRGLGLDVTESLVMQDIAGVAQVVEDCHRLGLQLALDDFGTGFSSLAHLKRLAVDELKIDSSFVTTMLNGPQDLAVVQSVIALGTAFKRRVSAEGVETLDQVLMLLELGCDVMQGYHLARPMSASQVVDWHRKFEPDTLWQLSLSSRPSRDYFELLLAETNHRLWIERLLHDNCRAAADRELNTLGNPGLCRFGRWYQMAARSAQPRSAEFLLLGELHDAIHQHAGQLCKNRRDGQDADAHAEELLLSAKHEEMRLLLNQMRQANENTTTTTTIA
jgi:diguanylate cyclase (GGDEF)-like protein/PAS domain S-box-containing protein